MDNRGPPHPSILSSALVAVLTLSSEGQGWVPRRGTSSLPPQARAIAQALLSLGGAGQGEGAHSGTRQEAGSFPLHGCPEPLLNTARRALTPVERENSHNTAIFKSEALCTLANGHQGFRSEETAWTPSVPPLQGAEECQELNSSRLLINHAKEGPFTLKSEPSSGAQAKPRADHCLSKGKVLINIWGSPEGAWEESTIYFSPCTVILQNKLASRLCS